VLTKPSPFSAEIARTAVVAFPVRVPVALMRVGSRYSELHHPDVPNAWWRTAADDLLVGPPDFGPGSPIGATSGTGPFFGFVGPRSNGIEILRIHAGRLYRARWLPLCFRILLKPRHRRSLIFRQIALWIDRGRSSFGRSQRQFDTSVREDKVRGREFLQPEAGFAASVAQLIISFVSVPRSCLRKSRTTSKVQKRKTERRPSRTTVGGPTRGTRGIRSANVSLNLEVWDSFYQSMSGFLVTWHGGARRSTPQFGSNQCRAGLGCAA
jgi:hypothetical protein